MTAEQHNKLFGTSLLAHSILLTIATIIAVYYFTDLILELLYSKNAIQNMLSLSFILLALAIAAAGAILIIPQFLGGVMILRETRTSPVWGTVACVFAIICLPIGTIIGIYGLWFMLSEKGKSFYVILNNPRGID